MEICYFKVPDDKDREMALGSLAGVKFQLKKSLKAILQSDKFLPIKVPKKGDWLWDHEEEGQPYEHYATNPNINFYEPSSRNTIYIQPLEQNISQEFLNQLKTYCRAFYQGAKVKIRNFNCKDILKQLEAQLPKDAYCLMGVMISDLYPEDDWNFVFGMASLRKRTGVFSLARYDERFYNEQNLNAQLDNDEFQARSLFVMLHEIGHMFGLKHCIYYECLMNGVNSLEEAKKKPSFLCPNESKVTQFTKGPVQGQNKNN